MFVDLKSQNKKLSKELAKERGSGSMRAVGGRGGRGMAAGGRAGAGPEMGEELRTNSAKGRGEGGAAGRRFPEEVPR